MSNILFQQEFADVAKKVAAFKKTPEESVFAEFYSLFKQATTGDINVGKYTNCMKNYIPVYSIKKI
jgi:acyl-CoA-binding protein